jgi:hypothetical protein
MTSDQPKKTNRFAEFLLRLCGPSFLLIACFFSILKAADICSMFSLWNVSGLLENIALQSMLLVLPAMLIGSWGIYETLRRSGSKNRFFALAGLGLSLLPILAYLISIPFTIALPAGQTNTDTAAPYVFLVLVILWAWVGGSLIGLAVMISKPFSRPMRLGAFLIIAGIPAEFFRSLLWDWIYQLQFKIPLETIFGEAGHWIFHHSIGTASAFKLMNLAGCLLIGIGFLRPPFRRSAIRLPTPEQTIGGMKPGGGESS